MAKDPVKQQTQPWLKKKKVCVFFRMCSFLFLMSLLKLELQIDEGTQKAALTQVAYKGRNIINSQFQSCLTHIPQL